MKMKKILALGLSLAMVLGIVAACSGDKEPAATVATPPTTAANDSDSNADESKPEVQINEDGGLVGYIDLGAAEVTNESSDPTSVWSFNTELQGLIEKYAKSADVEYQEVGGGYQEAYKQALDNALASGDQAPDVYACDADYAQLYMFREDSLPINDVGVDYKDLADMYNFTLQFCADDEGILKGIGWQSNPCAIFYNTALAAEYLGCDDPESVGAYFKDFDTLLETARLVNEKSNGDVKVVSGTDDVWRAYYGTRSTKYFVEKELMIDEPALDAYMDIAKILYDEDLTFKTTQRSDVWTANAQDGNALTYWGPMWLGQYSLGFADESIKSYGDWKICAAPSNFVWGGTYLVTPDTCDRKADVKDIIYGLAIDEANLLDQAKAGSFVNNIPIMQDVAKNDDYCQEWLGGQNPFSILVPIAEKVDYSNVGPNDAVINSQFTDAVGSYLSGTFETKADALASWAEKLEALGIDS